SYTQPTITDNGDGTYTAVIAVPPPDPTKGSAPYAVDFTASIPAPQMSSPVQVQLTNPVPRIVGPLHTSSPSGSTPAQILDANGRQVILEGMNALDTQFPYNNDGSEPLTPVMVGNLYNWGYNFVRLELSSDLLLQQCPQSGSSFANPYYDASYVDKIKDQVNLITSYGMYILLDMHMVEGNCQTLGSEAGGTGADVLPSQQEADAFWQRIAAEFNGNPLVGFEPYNEPHVCEGTLYLTSSYSSPCSAGTASAQAYVQGGTVSTGATTSYAAAGMAEMYNDIRAQSTSNLVFLDANGYASYPESFHYMAQEGMPSLSQTVYVFHYYHCQASSTNGTANCDTTTPEYCASVQALTTKNIDPVSGSLWPAPVVVDEFGWPEGETTYETGPTSTFTVAGNGLYINNVIAEMQQAGVGWALFAYGSFGPNPWQGPYDTILTPNFPAGHEYWTPSADGQAAINGIQAQAQGQHLNCTNPPAGDG
ncbi:MAG TPA: cellulase family glycosylhydrolase, partial [Acidimicrobiales bacterium]|nr:cellulase family glycosylhydrolase [Acidimicrobiales bacterium]